MKSGRIATVLCCALYASAGGGDSVDLTLRDSRSANPRRAIHDVTDLRLRMERGWCIVDVTMAKPLRASVFLDAHIEFDADNNASTGIDGFDFGVHAFAGSRFRANASTDREDDPLERRATVIKIHERGSMGRSFLHSERERLEAPRISGRTLQFRFPLDLIKTYGLRYNDRVRWRFFTESTISEHPVTTAYVCQDQGLKIDVDGRLHDWPPLGVQVKDKRGELHPDAAEIDITQLQVEHDAGSIYALVRLAVPGFGSAPLTGDVVDRDKIVVCLEPVGARAYMRFVEATAYCYEGAGRGTGHRHRVARGAVEFAFPRRAEQTKFRVLAYADAIRVDRVPDEGARVLVIPRKAWEEGDE